MQINSPSENRIIVELSAQDMQDLDITYDDMDYSAIETRRVIWTVLDAAGKYLGKELDPTRRMIIEALPLESGGCTLFFTILDTSVKTGRSKLIKQSGSLICDFDNLDGLFNAAEGCRMNSSLTQSSLYENHGKYRLIISSPFDLNLLERHFCEFAKCKKCETLEAEFTREHWNTIAETNALNSLARK